MAILRISAENAEYQIIQALKLNRVKRSKAKEIFIEGIESIKQAVSAGLEITRIIAANIDGLSSWSKDLIRENKRAKIIEMSMDLYKNICDRDEPSEIVATAKLELIELGSLTLSDRPFVLVFDRPSDCGNFGSIIRSANSFQVDAIFVVGHAIDIYDPKVIRSSLGSIFHSKVVLIPSMQDFQTWVADQKKKNALSVVGTDSTGEVSLFDQKLAKPIAVILGNEAKGMSVALKEMCDYIVRIPISGAVNSLNVACAGTIFLWDVYRNGLASICP
jgi:23S rRNA (uridine2479-2'-O)-methyltransferase